MNWHPAQTFSLAHQRDVARAFELALTGAMDGRIVNIADDAPSTLYDMARAVGVTIESSGEPLNNPWWGRADGGLSRRLCFRPTVATFGQAVLEGIL
jgi:UDP-glucose 4-epimerase